MGGVSVNTPVRLVVNGGELSVNDVDVGALPADSPVGFVVEREYYAPNFTGVRGDVEGTVYVIREVPKLTVTLSEWQLAKVQYAIPGTTFGSDASSETIDSTPGRITAATHLDTVKWLGAKADGFNLEIYVYNAICKENFEVEFPDEESSFYTVVFEGHYNPASTAAAPWKIVNHIA